MNNYCEYLKIGHENIMTEPALMAWNGMEWHGMAWNGMEWHGIGIIWHVLAGKGIWNGIVFTCLPSEFSWVSSIHDGLSFQSDESDSCQAASFLLIKNRDVSLRFGTVDNLSHVLTDMRYKS